MPAPNDITRLLRDWDRDREQVVGELTPLVYEELRRLASGYFLRERPDHTLQPTALIHEAWARLVDQKTQEWKDRAHSFGVAAQIMRQVLVDFARRQRAAKRGGGNEVSLEDVSAISMDDCGRFLEIHEALAKLEAFDARKCKVVELRCFGGLMREESAESLSVSLGILERDLELSGAAP